MPFTESGAVLAFEAELPTVTWRTIVVPPESTAVITAAVPPAPSATAAAIAATRPPRRGRFGLVVSVVISSMSSIPWLVWRHVISAP